MLICCTFSHIFTSNLLDIAYSQCDHSAIMCLWSICDKALHKLFDCYFCCTATFHSPDSEQELSWATAGIADGGLAKANKCSAVAEMGDRLAIIDMGWKLGGCILIQPAIWPQQTWAENWRLCPFLGGGAGSPSNTMWLGPRPTYTPSFILIHPTVWPQYTNITDRQQIDSIGRAVLQMVARKLSIDVDFQLLIW